MSNSQQSKIVPVHLGVIPDGNRRWAKDHGLTSLEGHRRGLDVAKDVALVAFDAGVQYFSMYAFSNENWSRTKEEVGYLMDLFVVFLTREFRELEEREVRFRFAGSRDRLPKKVLAAIDDVEARTAHHTRGTLVLCLNYGGQMELADAYRSMLRAGVQVEDVTPEVVAAHLYAPDVPPVDLVIRTSGEQRLSGFMLWRAAYAEFRFVQKHWPEFTPDDMHAALEDYAGRQRRFGA
jgi:undecaprenyl diphosphate synthase